jgi:transcriptional regulator with XRE-family HTH domain
MIAVQCKMARAALGLGVRDLADLAKVSPDTVARLERGEELRERTVDALRAALEAAGVEFTNGGQPGVRMKATSIAMPQQAFEEGLAAFIRDILPQRPALRIERPSELSVVLFLKDRKIAIASQRHGLAFFDPVPRHEGVVSADAVSVFGDWASIAYRQATEQEKPDAGSIAAEDLNASNDE